MQSLVFENKSLPSAGVVQTSPLPVAMSSKPKDIGVLFAAEESGLLHYALGLVGRRMVAEELVQETFLRLHKIWNDVENPRAWLYRSLRNLALNHLRDRPAENPLDEATAAAEQGLPVEAMGQAEAVGWVRTLLAEMPEQDRDLIQLKYRDDLRYDEISRRTGLSVGNVGYRLHHLLKALAKNLRQAGIESSQG